MFVINEKSTCFITLTFTDESGNLVTPTKVTYQIDDVLSNTAIKASTDFVPTSSSYDLEILWSDNALKSQDNKKEIRKLTVQFTYGATSEKGTAEFLYGIKNLGKVT
jgi:hypothetical protein